MTPLFFILFGLIVVIVAIFLVAASAFLDKSRKAEAFQRVAKSEPARA